MFKKIILPCFFFYFQSIFCQNLVEKTSAFIVVKPHVSKEKIESYGLKVISMIDSIWTVQVNSDQIDILEQIKEINFYQISNSKTSIKLNDIEKQTTKVDLVHQGTNLPMPYTGKGVIIGIVDIGFQNDHPTFFDPITGRTRIVRYWNQSYNNGTPPNGYSYGNEFSDTNLIKTQNDWDGSHGTHVAGIAGGSGLGSPNLQYKGMAPECEFVFVSIKYKNAQIEGSALGDYLIANPSIIDAYKYIFDYAESVGKPAVINLSWGMHTGSHDGNSIFDKAVEGLVGNGKIIVGANGNDGSNPMHLNYLFNNDTIQTFATESDRLNRSSESIYLDFWGSENSEFSVQVNVYDTFKNVIYSSPFISSQNHTSDVFISPNSEINIKYLCDSSFYTNNKPNINLQIEQSNHHHHFISIKITSKNSEVHGWNSGGVYRWTSGRFRNTIRNLNFTEMIDGNTNSTMGENGGTGKLVLSVGAMAARSSFTGYKGNFKNDSWYVTPGYIAPFSSKGPTTDDRIKPNITAPGFLVPSAVNRLQVPGWAHDNITHLTNFRGDTNFYMVSSGTSMASPHVCGIVALMLQANPKLNPTHIIDFIQNTATMNDQTGQVPNNTYGYGIVNAYEAVKKSLQWANVNFVNSENNFDIFPNPALNFITIKNKSLSSVTNISLIDYQGKKVISDTMNENEISINLNQISPGFYTILIENETGFWAFKILINN